VHLLQWLRKQSQSPTAITTNLESETKNQHTQQAKSTSEAGNCRQQTEEGTSLKTRQPPLRGCHRKHIKDVQIWNKHHPKPPAATAGKLVEWMAKPIITPPINKLAFVLAFFSKKSFL
jgi:hypothetical protein